MHQGGASTRSSGMGTLVRSSAATSRGAEGTDQLVLQVFDAHVEAELLHLDASEIGAEAGPLETALEVTLLCGVTEAGQSDAEPPRAEQIQEPSDVLRTRHRHDGNALGFQVSTASLGERFERELVAESFDEHDRPCGESYCRHWAVEVGVTPPLLVSGRPHVDKVLPRDLDRMGSYARDAAGDRHVDWDGCFNARDLGGCAPTMGGRLGGEQSSSRTGCSPLSPWIRAAYGRPDLRAMGCRATSGSVNP